MARAELIDEFVPRADCLAICLSVSSFVSEDVTGVVAGFSGEPSSCSCFSSTLVLEVPSATVIVLAACSIEVRETSPAGE